MTKTTVKHGITTALLALGALLAGTLPAGLAKHSSGDGNGEVLKREEMMVYNLNRGPNSARFYQLESLKATRLVQRNLEKAQHQVEQVDAAYAKVRKKPDERTMQPTATRLKEALITALQLETQLEDVGTELKSDIQQTLIRQP